MNRILWSMLILLGVVAYLGLLVLLSGSGVPSVEWVRSRTTLQWMSIIYPLLTASSAVSGLLMFLYWRHVRPVALVLANALVFFIEAMTLFILTTSTGNQPIFNIDNLRYWIVWARLAMLISFWIMDAICIYMLISHLRHDRKIVDFRVGQTRKEKESAPPQGEATPDLTIV